MTTHHWITLVIVAVIFYVIGVKFPSLAKKAGL